VCVCACDNPAPGSVDVVVLCHHDDDQVQEQRFMSTFNRSASSFRVIKELGQGCNGIVLLVQSTLPDHPFPGQQYALKVCYNYNYSTNTASRVFVNEFQLLARLPPHANVVHFVYDFFALYTGDILALLPEDIRDLAVVEQRGMPAHVRSTQYFVLHSYSMSLEHLLRRHLSPSELLPMALVRRVLTDVASALKFLQHHCVAHLDVKLDNVLVDVDQHGQVVKCVLADFGTARQLRPDMTGTASIDGHGRELSPHWGNEAHISPELHSSLRSALARRTACTIDLHFAHQSAFELAVLAHEIVAGGHPLGEYPAQYEIRHSGVVQYRDDDIVRLSEAVYPAEQAAVLRRGLACDPRARASLDELMQSFATLL
jgi:serine/threonine protein kinase